jgi:hypothetical protein
VEQSFAMSEPLRAPDPGEAPHPHVDTPELTSHHAAARFAASDDVSLAELRLRAREQAEAAAAVDAVMRREAVKAVKLAEAEGRQRAKPKPIRLVLLATLLLFNAYLWAGNPQWLTWHEPPAPSIDYYQNSYKMAVYLQRQRIEEYRKTKKKLPAAARQAGPPVRGVTYTPLAPDVYMLQAGKGIRMIVYSSRDSIAVFMGRTLEKLGAYGRAVR